MRQQEQLFLEALKAALCNTAVQWEGELSEAEWTALFRLAEEHHVLPLVFEAVYACPAARNANSDLMLRCRQQTVRQVMGQAVRTDEFLRLYRRLAEHNVKALVVKGIICRSVYPNPDHRLSSDEDMLISPVDFSACDAAIQSYGMRSEDEWPEAEHEVSYRKPSSALYIELHKSLFAPDSEAYGDWNRFFEDAVKRAVSVTVQGVPVWTMEHTDHLFYLICHAFKHFLHSGFGIRQVCDIIMFSQSCGRHIDWTRVLEQCREIHAELFAAAIFKIGQKYLAFDAQRAYYPDEWQSIPVDEAALLEDLLSGGVYGSADRSRLHSSNMTLNAVAAQKQGKKASNTVFKTVFPSAKALEKRYPYLRKHPYLLPLAWASRILQYRKETSKMSHNNAADSIRIGNQRIELLRQYGVIDPK